MAGKNTGTALALPRPGDLTLTSASLVSPAQQKHSPRADGPSAPLPARTRRWQGSFPASSQVLVPSWRG